LTVSKDKSKDKSKDIFKDKPKDKPKDKFKRYTSDGYYRGSLSLGLFEIAYGKFDAE
jgi:hypothetical protein